MEFLRRNTQKCQINNTISIKIDKKQRISVKIVNGRSDSKEI